ncbi:MAG: hypothetical protein ACSHX8_15625 [Opitutaceae bacterium]
MKLLNLIIIMLVSLSCGNAHTTSCFFDLIQSEITDFRAEGLTIKEAIEVIIKKGELEDRITNVRIDEIEISFTNKSPNYQIDQKYFKVAIDLLELALQEANQTKLVTIHLRNLNAERMIEFAASMAGYRYSYIPDKREIVLCKKEQIIMEVMDTKFIESVLSDTNLNIDDPFYGSTQSEQLSKRIFKYSDEKSIFIGLSSEHFTIKHAANQSR